MLGRRLVDRAVARFDERIGAEQRQARRDRELERATKRVERLLEAARFGSAVVQRGARQKPADG
jgi:hypothetical protein